MAEEQFPFLAQFLKETSRKEPVRTDKTLQAKVSSVLSGESLGISQKNNSPSAGGSSNFFRKCLRSEATKPTKPYLDGDGACMVLPDRKAHCQTLVELLELKGVTAAMLTGTFPLGSGNRWWRI